MLPREIVWEDVGERGLWSGSDWVCEAGFHVGHPWVTTGQCIRIEFRNIADKAEKGAGRLSSQSAKFRRFPSEDERKSQWHLKKELP